MTATESRHYFEALSESKVDSGAGVIRGVSLISVGEARGHKDDDGRQIFVDEKTCEQVFQFCKQAGSIKVKADHGSGVFSIIGYVDSFYQDGDKTKGNFHIYDSEPERNRIFEVAAKNPTHLGMSLEFSGADEEDGNKCLARCSEVSTVALVSDPAANKSLFDKKTVDINAKTEKPKTMPEPTDDKKETEAKTEDKPEITLESLSAKFDEFASKFAKKFGDEPDGDEAPADKKDEQPADKKTEELDDEPKDEKAKLEKAAEMGAQNAFKLFATKMGIDLKAGVSSDKKPETEKTFAQIVEAETKNFGGDKDKAMLHCIKTHKKEYAASRLVSK